jgi:DNA polymerase III subunit delta
MPVYLLYGEDTYSLNRKINQLIGEKIHPHWKSFNYLRLASEKDITAQIFTELMTVPFGEGKKVIRVDSEHFIDSLSKYNNKDLEDKLSQIPTNNILLISGSRKPDCRKGIVKILLKFAQTEEFNLVPSWDKPGIKSLLGKYAVTHRLKVTPDVFHYLVEAIGNNTARADSEFTKLAIYANGKTLDIKNVRELVSNSNTEYSQLATAMARNHSNLAIERVYQLLGNNEHPIKIVATLTSIFRTWLIIKTGVEVKLPDTKTAEIAELKNPKRLYYLKDEVKYLKLEKLKKSLLVFAQLESELKSGTNNLTNRIVEICNL